MVNDQGKEVSLRKTLAYGTRYGIGVFCLTVEREEQIGWVPEKEQSLFDAIGMAYNLPNFRAKTHSASCKNHGDNFTKIPIAVICEYHDFLLFIYCSHYKYYIIVLFINSSKERQMLRLSFDE